MHLVLPHVGLSLETEHSLSLALLHIGSSIFIHISIASANSHSFSLFFGANEFSLSLSTEQIAAVPTQNVVKSVICLFLAVDFNESLSRKFLILTLTLVIITLLFYLVFFFLAAQL